MRFSLLSMIVPSLALVGFVIGMDQLYSTRFDHGFAWALVVLSAGAAILGNALHVSSVNDRIRHLEDQYNRLADKFFELEKKQT